MPRLIMMGDIALASMRGEEGGLDNIIGASICDAVTVIWTSMGHIYTLTSHEPEMSRLVLDLKDRNDSGVIDDQIQGFSVASLEGQIRLMSWTSKGHVYSNGMCWDGKKVSTRKTLDGPLPIYRPAAIKDFIHSA